MAAVTLSSTTEHSPRRLHKRLHQHGDRTSRAIHRPIHRPDPLHRKFICSNSLVPTARIIADTADELATRVKEAWPQLNGLSRATVYKLVAHQRSGTHCRDGTEAAPRLQTAKGCLTVERRPLTWEDFLPGTY